MRQSQIDDDDISSDKFRNEYIMGHIKNRELKNTLGIIHFLNGNHTWQILFVNIGVCFQVEIENFFF